MVLSKYAFCICVGVLLLVGCATRKYHVAPISPAEAASSLQLRTLHDAGLKEYLERSLGKEKEAWPPRAWDLEMLTLAAFYFSPTLEA